ncbi:trp operon leader peptide [Streptomyces sp. NPDC050535]
MTLSSVGLLSRAVNPWMAAAGRSEPAGRAVHAVARPRYSGRVRRMFAHSIQTWWWTAHPAAR